jgi:hypothetical protein
MKWYSIADGIILFVLVLLAAMALSLVAGCATSRDQQIEQNRTTKRETVEVRQEIHDGQVVKLTNKTIVLERESTDQQQTERTEVEQPEILGSLADAAKTGAKALAGATIGPAGPAAVDWIWQTVAGVAGLGTAGGVGAVIRERNARRKVEQDAADEAERRNKVAKAMDDYAADIEDATTPEQAAAVKEKHRRRQIALGIHEDVERARHG